MLDNFRLLRKMHFPCAIDQIDIAYIESKSLTQYFKERNENPQFLILVIHVSASFSPIA